jgi:hypothetical protein
MTLKRNTIILVGGAALAAWFSAAMTPGRPPAASIAIRSAPIDQKGAVLAGEIERLHERLRPDVAPREATRNPFVFRSSERPARVPRVGATPEKDRPVPVPAAIEAPRLRLTLAGIAEDPGRPNDAGSVGHPGGAPVRTAIIAGNGQVFLAKEGDTVADRDVEYKIGKVFADSVELIDLRDNAIRRLALK